MEPQRHEPATPAADRKVRIVGQTPDLRVAEYVLEPGERLPWHHHSEATGRFHCLEGMVGVELRGPERQLLLHPGETCTVQPGTVHRSGNAAEGVSRYLLPGRRALRFRQG